VAVPAVGPSIGRYAAAVRRVLNVGAAIVLVLGALVVYLWVTSATDNGGGHGWRLAAAVRGGGVEFQPESPGEARLLTDAAALDAAWELLGAPADEPAIDFGREAAVLATTFGSGSCPPHLDGVDIGAGRITVTSSHGFVLACTADAVPYSFLIAVDRDRMPQAPFTVRIRSDDFSTDVTVD
jgi:hypothetical protein